MYNNKCDNCGIELTNTYSYSGGFLFSQKHNFFQAFLSKKGKNKEGNDEFKFCDECEKEFKNYLVEEVIKELNQSNIANSEILTYRFFSTNFTEENWRKYQIALAENIKRHSGEWKIKQVNYQREKLSSDLGVLTKETILFHQSFKLEYDPNGSLIFSNAWDPRKIYFETDFLSQQWTEIENKINSEYWGIKNDNNSPNLNQSKNILIILGVIGLIIGIVILLVYLTKIKKIKNIN